LEDELVLANIIMSIGNVYIILKCADTHEQHCLFNLYLHLYLCSYFITDLSLIMF